MPSGVPDGEGESQRDDPRTSSSFSEVREPAAQLGTR